jgi:hypothetical protein
MAKPFRELASKLVLAVAAKETPNALYVDVVFGYVGSRSAAIPGWAADGGRRRRS